MKKLFRLIVDMLENSSKDLAYPESDYIYSDPIMSDFYIGQ